MRKSAVSAFNLKNIPQLKINSSKMAKSNRLENMMFSKKGDLNNFVQNFMKKSKKSSVKLKKNIPVG